MDFGRLEKNITDQIKEAQLKLGYAEETVRLYYPLSSLNALLRADVGTEKEMCALLSQGFGGEERLGRLTFRAHAGRIEIGISPQGARYVHEQVATPAFLRELITLFQTQHAPSLERICEVFGKYDDGFVCEEMPEGSDFDYVIYFADGRVDEYYYCVKMEMGHTIYHRFMKEDYLMLL